MLKRGIEPQTFALLARRSNQLSYSSTSIFEDFPTQGTGQVQLDLIHLSSMQTGHRRFASSTDGEEFIEEYNTFGVLSTRHSKSKRQRIEKSSIRFYHEPIASLPNRLQHPLSSLVSLSRNHLETSGRVCENGQIVCAINGTILFWRIPPLCEFFRNFDVSQYGIYFIFRTITCGLFRILLRLPLSILTWLRWWERFQMMYSSPPLQGLFTFGRVVQRSIFRRCSLFVYLSLVLAN